MSRKKAVGLLILASVFVAVGVVMVADGIAFGWVAIAFFGLGVPLSVWQLVAPGSLTIDETTIEVRAVGQATSWLHRFIARHLRVRGPRIVGTPEHGSRPLARRMISAELPLVGHEKLDNDLRHR